MGDGRKIVQILWLIFLFYYLIKIVKRLPSGVGFGGFETEKERIAAIFPKSIPSVDALFLHFLGRNKDADAGGFLYQRVVHHPFQHGRGFLEVAQRRLGCFTLRHAKNGLLGRVGLGHQLAERLLLLLGHVVDFVHVGLERGLEAENEKEAGEQNNDDDEPRVLFGVELGDTAERKLA